MRIYGFDSVLLLFFCAFALISSRIFVSDIPLLNKVVGVATGLLLSVCTVFFAYLKNKEEFEND